MTDTKQAAQTGGEEENDDGTEIELDLPDEQDGTESALDETDESIGQSGGSEDETGAEPEGERPLTSRRTGRGDARIQHLANVNSQLQRELAELKAARQAEEQRKLVEAMSPEERQNFMQEQRLARMEFQMNDTSDRSSFEMKAQTNPIYRRYAPMVEEALAHVRANGQNMPREAVLQVLVGRDALARAPKSQKRQIDAAARRRAAVRSTPANGRGDAGGASGTRKTLSLREKLADVPI